MALTLPPEVEAATVTRPDGSTVRLAPAGGRAVFADTTQLGVYEVTWQHPEPVEGEETGRAGFAVNLFTPQESDARPAETLPLVGVGGTGEGERPQQARREWWRPLVWIALALLVTEWLVYHRASLARLWQRMKSKA